MPKVKVPKVFITYAWEEGIRNWVLDFATRLRNDGVDAILDQWDAVPGDPLTTFIETSIQESDFILVVCTPKYKTKSDSGSGGVGYEGAIITGELFYRDRPRKIIPILRKGNWAISAPTWIADTVFVDLRDDPYNENSYQSLLTTLHGGYQKESTNNKFDRRNGNQSTLSVIYSIGVLVSIILVFLLVRSISNDSGFFYPRTSEPFTLTPPFKLPTPSLTPIPSHTPLPMYTLTSTPFPAEIVDNKNVPMLLVPAGAFTMGIDSSTALKECLRFNSNCIINWFKEEGPPFDVFMNEYYIDKYEVSNFQFKSCVDTGVCLPPEYTSSESRKSYYGNSEFDNYPVIYVDWHMAKTYCEWRGARLPTEAEWEKAARGRQGYLYPWGNEFKGEYTNFCDKNCISSWGNEMVNDGYSDTAPVNSYQSGVSPYGVYNMAGNVWEWVSSLYRPYPYALDDGRENLNDFSDDRVMRGGSLVNYPYNLLTTHRVNDLPTDIYLNVGFRCARSVP